MSSFTEVANMEIFYFIPQELLVGEYKLLETIF